MAFQRQHRSRTQNRSFGSRHSFGKRHSGKKQTTFPRFERRSFGGRPRKPHTLDISKFVNRAKPFEAQADEAPTHTFADFGLDYRVQKAITRKGFDTPTPIQDKAISPILEGRDIVGIANTGTGKTGAFLLPLIHRMLQDRNLHVLVVAPTRELAIQIEKEYRDFAFGTFMYSVCCVGGAPIYPQLRELRRKHRIIIGTPGRIKDFIEKGEIRLEQFCAVVLDEADRMLDMGFIGDMRFILSKMPQKRHTLFFSATLSRDIEGLIGEFLHNPVRISVKLQDTAQNIDQDVVRIERGGSKLETLVALLKRPEFKKVLVFGKTKIGVEKLSRLLGERGFAAQAIHGNKTHGKRQSALRLFKENHARILVATDVAARGLDISGISHVINYDMPATYEDYVHRIGRTGRGKAQGKALTLVEGH